MCVPACTHRSALISCSTSWHLAHWHGAECGWILLIGLCRRIEAPAFVIRSVFPFTVLPVTQTVNIDWKRRGGKNPWRPVGWKIDETSRSFENDWPGTPSVASSFWCETMFNCGFFFLQKKHIREKGYMYILKLLENKQKQSDGKNSLVFNTTGVIFARIAYN